MFLEKYPCRASIDIIAFLYDSYNPFVFIKSVVKLRGCSPLQWRDEAKYICVALDSLPSFSLFILYLFIHLSVIPSFLTEPTALFLHSSIKAKERLKSPCNLTRTTFPQAL